jgi:hypothetical protein
MPKMSPNQETVMKILIPFILLCTALLLPAQPAAAESFIWINVSVKVIVSPNTGYVPLAMNDAALRDSFVDMNRWLANTWRGYRLRLVDLDGNQNFKRIGSQSDPPAGPSKWYFTDLKWDGVANHQFETEAKADKLLYGWNDFAINLYFNNGTFSSAQFPWSGWDLVQSAYGLFIDQVPAGSVAPTYVIAGNLLHEIGHWFGLCHTFENTPCGVWPDTLLDPQEPDGRNEPVVRDSIAQANYGTSYSDPDRSDYERWLVDNTANNAMSYYQLFYDDPVLGGGKVLTDAERFGPTRFIFTEKQMDAWADCANTGRCRAATSGRTWFVKPGTAPGGDGSSANEFQLISQGETAANDAGGDILLLRQGAYAGPMLITKPLTLRATREGSALLGQ